jgi:hypothetical protein
MRARGDAMETTVLAAFADLKTQLAEVNDLKARLLNLEAIVKATNTNSHDYTARHASGLKEVER